MTKRTEISDTALKSAAFAAAAAAGATVNERGGYGTINGRHPRWEIRHDRFLGKTVITHVNVGRGKIGRGLKIIRPKAGQFDFAVIAAALIEDVARQNAERQETARRDQEDEERENRRQANTDAVVRILSERGAPIARFGTIARHTQLVGEYRLTARADGILFEMATAMPEADVRAVVDAVERALSALRVLP